MKTKKIKIKGNTWTIKYLDSINDKYWGATDSTSKTIRIWCQKPEETECDNFDEHIDRTIRHELLHAFLHECGLGHQMHCDDQGHDEQLIDWLACQYPEYKAVCDELGI